MKKSIFFALCFFCSYSIFAQGVLKSIPYTIFKSSNTVIRRFATDVRVFNSNKTEVAEYVFVSFKGIEELRMYRINSMISKSINLKKLTCKVYDKNGKRSKKLDALVGVENSWLRILITDKIVEAIFPLSIELEYKAVLVSFKNSQKWLPVADSDTKVQHASLRLSVSDSSAIDYTNYLIPSPQSNMDDSGNYVTIWELNDYLSVKKGSSKELPRNDFPYVILYSKE